MKIFLHFLLTIVMVTAATHGQAVSKECKLQRQQLREIIDSVTSLLEKSSQIPVENVITPHTCTYENFCKAGKILAAYEAEEIGLNHAIDWRLPRQLVAYSKNDSCKVNSASADQVHLHHLLRNIKECAQSHYRKSCN